VVNQAQMIERSESSDDRKRVERRKLDQLLGFCESVRCRRQVLLEGFGEVYPRPCGNCDNCLEPADTWDGSVAVQKALSCIYRTGQRFGVVHLIDVLRGADHERIRQHGHDKLTVYGLGRDLDESTWRSVYRQILAGGLAVIDIDGYGALRLTEASRAVLRGEQPVRLRRDPEVIKGKRGPKPGTARRSAVEFADPDTEARFLALRELRSRLAREQNVPAYVIFHDSTLAAIAEADPQDLDELGEIAGLGARKLERYGEAVLDALGEL
jgi:ATP-dependent DNA helicase RecQ